MPWGEPHQKKPGGIPPERLRAALRFLGSGEMTPQAHRILKAICDEYEDADQTEPDRFGQERSDSE